MDDKALDDIARKSIGIVRHSKNYLIGVWGKELLAFVYIVFVSKALGPDKYGLWTMFLLVLSYGRYMNFGLNNCLVQQVCFYKGKGMSDDVEDIRSTVFNSVVIISLVVSIIALFLGAKFLLRSEYNLYIVFCVIIWASILQQLNEYFVRYYISENNFLVVSRIMISVNALILILSVVLIAKLKLIGLSLAIALAHLFVLVSIFIRYKPRIRWRLNIKRIPSLIKIGFPIAVSLFLFIFFLSIEKILIFKYLGREKLGYYGVGSCLSNFLILLPLSFGIPILTRLSEIYGARENISELKELIRIPSTTVMYCVSFIAGLSYILLPSLITVFLPRYTPGIAAGRVALAGAIFFSVSIPLRMILFATGRHLQCVFIILFGILLKILLISIFIDRGLGIIGAAVSTNIAYFIYSLIIARYTFYVCNDTFLELGKYLIRIYFPSVYVVIILFGLNHFSQFLNFPADGRILHFSIGLILFLTFVAVPFTRIVRKTIRLRA